MIRYSRVHTGATCDRRCSFCPERGGAPAPLEQVRSEIAAIPPPRNLFFGEGDPASGPELLRLLAEVRMESPRRLKLKLTRRLPGDLYRQLLGLGVFVYELECLGPTPAVQDAITGSKGSFAETVAAVRQLRGGRGGARAPFWTLRVPICEANRAHLPALVSRAIEWRPDRVHFRSCDDTAVSGVALELRSACARLVGAEIWPVLSGFPLCAVSGLEPFCQELYDREVEHPAAPLCQGCVLEPACCHVRPSYLATYGEGEFRAVAWHRHAEDILALAARSGARP